MDWAGWAVFATSLLTRADRAPAAPDPQSDTVRGAGSAFPSTTEAYPPGLRRHASRFSCEERF